MQQSTCGHLSPPINNVCPSRPCVLHLQTASPSSGSRPRSCYLTPLRRCCLSHASICLLSHPPPQAWSSHPNPSVSTTPRPKPRQDPSIDTTLQLRLSKIEEVSNAQFLLVPDLRLFVFGPFEMCSSRESKRYPFVFP
uniref:Uncharacterized protein n=1 Tax=Arundo donax TaxID=35708 RepID=A0A0A9CK09_ARUDO